MAKGFELSFDFVEKWGRFAKPEYLQIYIYLLGNYKKTGEMLSPAVLAKKLDKKIEKVEAALDFWVTAEELEVEDSLYSFTQSSEKKQIKSKTEKIEKSKQLRERPSYSPAEIDAVASVNKDIDYLFKQAETILGRMLNQYDYELLYSFVDWLGLPVEVVVMLLTFAANRGKTGKRYLESVALDWCDKGIDNYESAENYIKEIELKLSAEGRVRSVLGIYDRALSQTEKKYIKQWVFEKNIPVELISEAYDRTVSATGKLSWGYMNKILLSWAREGLSSVEQVKEYDALYKLKNAPSKTRNMPKRNRANNYVDTNKEDYSNFAEQILNDMLEG